MTRFIHFDETEISAEEPVTVVLGMISSPDHHWKEIQAALADVVACHIHEDACEMLPFHAKDIWHGSGYFDRELFPRAERRLILRQLLMIPGVIPMPLVVGVISPITGALLRSPKLSARSAHYALTPWRFRSRYPWRKSSCAKPPKRANWRP